MRFATFSTAKAKDIGSCSRSSLREAATEEAPEKPIVKKPTSLQIREEEKRAGSEGRQRGNARGSDGLGNTTATAKNAGLLSCAGTAER